MAAEPKPRMAEHEVVSHPDASGVDVLYEPDTRFLCIRISEIYDAKAARRATSAVVDHVALLEPPDTPHFVLFDIRVDAAVVRRPN